MIGLRPTLSEKRPQNGATSVKTKRGRRNNGGDANFIETDRATERGHDGKDKGLPDSRGKQAHK